MYGAEAIVFTNIINSIGFVRCCFYTRKGGVITNYCKIGGKTYDVNVIELEESFNILFTDNTKRTLAAGGAMFLDPIGTFIGHKVTFAPLNNRVSFDELWNFFKVPRRVGFPVELADNQSTIAYSAYTSSGSRKLTKVINGVVYWDTFEVNIIPMEAQIMS